MSDCLWAEETEVDMWGDRPGIKSQRHCFGKETQSLLLCNTFLSCNVEEKQNLKVYFELFTEAPALGWAKCGHPGSQDGRALLGVAPCLDGLPPLS